MSLEDFIFLGGILFAAILILWWNREMNKIQRNRSEWIKKEMKTFHNGLKKK